MNDRLMGYRWTKRETKTKIERSLFFFSSRNRTTILGAQKTINEQQKKP